MPEEEAERAVGVEVPEGDSHQAERGKPPLVKIALIAAVLIVQAVSSHIIIRQVFYSKPPAAVAQKADPGKRGQVFQLNGIVVNPTGTNGTKHLLLDIGFEVGNSKIIEELTIIDPLIRDNLMTFLAAQRVEVLTDIMMRDRIRQRIREIVNYHLTTGEVDKVYFVRYVFQ